ncbi:MAG: chromosome partitioning protein [Coriobacteriaceae bacterium]|nr:chromosome partitioning protein [Coriobacteriaceae bacterium]
MKTIAVVCEKGGTGKSVIAAELYESYVRQGLRTSLYSLDGQYSDSPRSKKVDDAEVAVVDTPGVLTDNLTDIVKGADVVVVPVRPTPNDIEPFTRTVSIVAKNTKAPIVIVVNGTNRFRMCASFMEWLGKKPWAKNVVTVPQSEAIVQAQGMQKSVVNVDGHGIAAEAVRRMCRMVSTLAGLPFEHKVLKK